MSVPSFSSILKSGKLFVPLWNVTNVPLPDDGWPVSLTPEGEAKERFQRFGWEVYWTTNYDQL